MVVTSKASPVVVSQPITLKFGMKLLVDIKNERMSVFCDSIFLTRKVISLMSITRILTVDEFPQHLKICSRFSNSIIAQFPQLNLGVDDFPMLTKRCRRFSTTTCSRISIAQIDQIPMLKQTIFYPLVEKFNKFVQRQSVSLPSEF